VGESKHNTLLRCKVLKDRQHVSALFYRAIIRSDMVKGPKHVVYLLTPYTAIKCCVLTHPPDIILIFHTVIAHNGDEPLKDWNTNLQGQPNGP